jgi:predicted transcriptional regulator
MKIYGDFLLILSTEFAHEEVVISRLQSRINVPFTRLKKYIAELKELGLIEDETTLKISKKGKEYIEQYEDVIAFMKRMGMSYE